MLEFPCPRCGRRLRTDAVRAGRKCRCGACGEVVDVPLQACVAAEPAAEKQSLPSTDEFVQASAVPDGAPELYDFLAPAEAPGELGRLGGYRVLRVLGAGGMGVVFQAEDPRLKRPVALKAMLPVMAASATSRQRFVLEAQAAAAIEHDHIVTIYQVGEDRRIPFIAMQLLQGESLEDRLVRLGRLDPAEALLITKQIAAGLAVAHERGLIHRDIKPSNLWLEQKEAGGSSSFRVKILDFGLARSVEGDTQLTQPGAIVGTPAYLAPEQARRDKLDGRCDLFSLGCVLYRMTTGRLPFQGKDTLTTLLSLARDDPPPPQQLNPQLPPGLSRLIEDLLAKDPGARPPSARAVIQRIEDVARDLPRSRAASAPVAESPFVAPAVTPRVRTLVEPHAAASHTALLERRPGTKKKWLLMAAGLAGVGLVVLLGIGVLAVVLWVNRGDGRDRTPGNKPAEGKPSSSDTGAGDPNALAAARNAVQTGNYSQTDVVGFPLHPAFEDIPAEGALLIGFEIGIGKWDQKDIIQSVRPIFLTANGEVPGAVRGVPSDRKVTVKAKPGYAVGAVTLLTHLRIDGMVVTFMKVDRKTLDPDQSYQSELIATIGGQHGAGKTVTGHGALVIGICGKSDGQVCDALGLVLRGKFKR